MKNHKVIIGHYVGYDVIDPKTFEEFKEQILKSEKRLEIKRTLSIHKNSTGKCECGREGPEIWLACAETIPVVVIKEIPVEIGCAADNIGFGYKGHEDCFKPLPPEVLKKLWWKERG